MARKYSIAEARSQLPAIIDEVEDGQDVELTRRGRPVAVVVSHREIERLRGKRPRFRDLYKNFLQRYSLAEIGTTDDLVPARDKKAGRKVTL